MEARIPISSGGEMPGYLALPKRPGAGVVVLHEIFGVTPALKAVCDWLASRQFVAICPELFWRTDPGLVLSETDREQGFAAKNKVDTKQVIADIASAVTYLRKHPHVTGGVGVLGFCWGGLLSYLSTTMADAAVSYYGVGIEQHLTGSSVSCPMLLHYAGLDKLTPPEAVDRVETALAGNPIVKLNRYENADHGFARRGGRNFQAASADLADMRTLAFFVETLVGRRESHKLRVN